MTIQSKELLNQLTEAHRTIGGRDARIERLNEKISSLELRLASAERAGLPSSLVASEAAVRSLVRAVGERRKIDAIKAVRELTGLGLKEAKDLVEQCCPTAMCT